MNEAARIDPAAVRPRVFTADSEEALLLADVVAEHLQRGDRRPVCIVGATGAGKSTALRHLAAVMPTLTLLDEPALLELDPVANAGRPLVFTTNSPPPPALAACCALAAWSDDDLLEYLLARHPDRCGSVLARLGTTTDREAARGRAELCAAALDRLASDDQLHGIRAALLAEVRARVPTARHYRLAAASCLHAEAGAGVARVLACRRATELAGPGAHRLLRHGTVSALVAAELLLEDLTRADTRRVPKSVPSALLRFAGSMLAAAPALRQDVERLAVRGPARRQSFLVSLMHAAFPDWTPGPLPLVQLVGARLDTVPWDTVTLAGADLARAWLRGAHLERANLDNARAMAADFGGAQLSAASMFHVFAWKANFAGADLREVDAGRARLVDCDLRGVRADGARLRGAILRRARLDGAVFAGAGLQNAELLDSSCADVDWSGAVLDGAQLSGTDLRTASLRGASLVGTDLRRCHLEGVELPPTLTRARLDQADLTGSVVSDGDLRDASLRGARLGDVRWQNADLRGADLRRATFHMGSARSGLLFSATAGEGSRTGFYSDDSLDDHFKAPEEMRKADLRGADLRGARIDDVDFYLVDLRGGRWDPEQEPWLLRSGAILRSRAVDDR